MSISGGGRDRYYREAVIAFLFQRDGSNCGVCRKELGEDRGFYLTVDHTLPLSEDGPNTLENMRLVHRRCNTSVYWKGRKRPYLSRPKQEKVYQRQPRPDVGVRNQGLAQRAAVKVAWEAGKMERSKKNLSLGAASLLGCRQEVH